MASGFRNRWFRKSTSREMRTRAAAYTRCVHRRTCRTVDSASSAIVFVALSALAVFALSAFAVFAMSGIAVLALSRARFSLR